MKSLLTAVSFLTRIPVPSLQALDAGGVARSSRWFPLVGLLVGLIETAVVYGLLFLFPASVVAVLTLAVEALVTGALHFDGLADMADGFGGGTTREQVLRIMKDHAVGSYGAIALILLIALKIVALVRLIELHQVLPYLLVATVLARWTPVLQSVWLPYARVPEEREANQQKVISEEVNRWDFFLATLLAVAISTTLMGWQVLKCWLVILLISGVVGYLCRRRIGGVTGDTLGANIQLCETAVLLTGTFGSSSVYPLLGPGAHSRVVASMLVLADPLC
ncbi:MAG: adenosylcobinamide-GDP ribazoletransferase [Acidobacteriota bacterium]